MTGTHMLKTGVLALTLYLSLPFATVEAGLQSYGLESYYKAREIIDAGIAAMGGEEALWSLTSVRRDLIDEWVSIGQQPRPMLGPFDPERVPTMFASEVISYIDYGSRVWVWADRFDDGPGSVFLQVDGGGPDGGFSKGHYYDEPAFYGERDDAAAHSAWASEVRRYPEGLLKLALERPETLQWVGTGENGKRRFDVVSVVDTEGVRVLLYFDGVTHLLSRAETLRVYPVLGDTTADIVYDDYRAVGPLMLPYSYLERLGGVPRRRLRAQAIAVGAPAPVDLFAPPENFVWIERPPEEPTLHALGDGVYEILGPYNVMFAVFADYVLLIEAPLGENYVESLLDLIASVAPGKPVRAVATHFHYDHIGGARALAVRGIPILAPADAEPVIREALSSRMTMRPDLYAKNPRPLVFEAAGRETVFDDGAQRVEIYDVGPAPHAEHMLAAYFPKQKTLYVADLWDVRMPLQPIAGIDAEALMREVARLGLEVARMVPTHGVPANGDNLKHGLAIREKHVAADRRDR